MRSNLLTMVLGTFLFGSMACMDPRDVCANDAISSHLSPDQQWHAVLFHHDCGALTTLQVGISVLRVGQDLPPRDEGNVLHYLNTVSVPQVLERDDTLRLPELEWKSATQLNIKYDRRVVVRRKLETLGPVQIWYIRYDRS